MGKAANWSDRKWLSLIVAAGFLLLLPGIFHLPLLDRDEPRFARAAVEMLERDSPLVPWFNGKHRFDKPPLTYWLMWPGLRLLGETEAAVRMPSVIGAVLVGVMIFSLGRRMGLAGPEAGFAALTWLSCLQVLIHGRMAVADMNLLVFLVLSMRCTWELCEAGTRMRDGLKSGWFHGLWLAMGLGFLAKGPLALAVPLLAMGGMALIEWKWLPARDGRALRVMAMLGIAIIPAMGLVAVWGIPALLETNGKFYDEGIGTHVVKRGLFSFNDRSYIPGVYYLLVLPIFISPWAALLPAIRDGVSTRDAASMFLLSWLLAPFAIFSFFVTQLPHYILPSYPSLLLLMCFGMKKNHHRRWSIVLGYLITAIFLVLALAAAWGACLASRLDDGLALAMGGLTLFASGLTTSTWLATRPNGKWRAIAVMLIAVIGFQCAAIGLAKVHLTKRLILAMGQNWHSPAASGYQEPSLVWYGSTQWEMQGMLSDKADIQVVKGKRWRLDSATLLALITGRFPSPVGEIQKEHLEWVKQGAMKVQGLSIADGSWMELWFRHAERSVTDH